MTAKREPPSTDAAAGNDHYRAHIVLMVLAMIFFVAAALVARWSPWLFSFSGLCFVGSGIAAFFSGRAVGTVSGFILHVAHRDSPPAERARIARRRGQVVGVWFIFCGVALVVFAWMGAVA